jgi:tRNA-specific 2-thiouridylase
MKVFLGMSGGVDSAVSAYLLQQQGHEVIGVYMKNWSKNLPGMKCPWAEDLADAKRVAVKLGIDFRVFDFESEYKQKVVDYMLAEYQKGNTPNPDIMCNQEIKFKLFYEKAMEAGADFIATGHYARTSLGGSCQLFSSPISQKLNGGPPPELSPAHVDLLRAVDENKDQTYFLYRISEYALSHTIFPIGEMMKPDVKKLAEKHGLHNAYKKESMGVCFVGEVGMKDFLKEYIDIEPGEIREIETEKVLGVHEGAVFYTIGQRHGLYISGVKGEVNDGLPYYVVKKDLEHNIIYVSKNLNHSAIWTKELKLQDVLIRTNKPNSRPAPSRPSLRGSVAKKLPVGRNGLELDLLVRLRHRAPLIPAKLVDDTLYFEQEIKRPASGQSAVFYDGEVCLGGGIIL